MLPEQDNTNITPIKSNNESSLKYGAYPDPGQKTPSAAFKFCKSISEINTQNENGWTPIYQSIMSNNLEALYDLLKLGANPDIPNNLGETPLYLTVDTKNYDALIILLQYNANCNLAKKNGNTPLHLATKKNLDIFMSALLRNNADPNIVNKLYSQTPTHLAIINKVDENTLVEFNMSKADIYNFKDKYDKSPFDYAKESGDQNYINLLKKIFGEDNNILNSSNKQQKAGTEKQSEYNHNETPVNINNEYKNNTNFENRKVLFSFEENYLNKNNSSVIIKSIENKNLLFSDGTESKNKVKEDENQENPEITSTEEKNNSKINKTQEIKEDLKLNSKSQEKEENKNNSTDTIQKLSISKSGEMKSQFQIEKNKNYTISYNQNQNQTNKDINNSINENKNSFNNLKKSNSNNNSINNKINIKDISEMNPLDMINQVITTSSNVFSELQMNSNTMKNNQSDEYFNNKSGRENTSNFLNNLMINDSLEYSKSNTHLISDISTKRQNNDKTKSSNEYNDAGNFNGLNITINEYEDMNKNNNNTNSKKINKNKQISYHKQNINENKENVDTNSNEKRSSINSSMMNNNKKITKEGRTITNQNEILTQNSTSQGENIITKVKYFNSAQNSPENQREVIPKDSYIDEDKNKILKNYNVNNNNNYNIKSLIDQQSTINTYSNNLNNKTNKCPFSKLSEIENNNNSYLIKNINKSEELNLCSPQNIQNEVLTRLREWLISCDLLCYYNLLIKNDMYDIDLYIKNLKNNKINISYKDIEDIGIKKPGHIFRFLLKLQIDTGILDEQICNSIINKFSTNLLTTIGLTASTNIVKCCGITLFKQNGDNESSNNKSICCTVSDSDTCGNSYNDIFGFLKYKGLMAYKENFIHNGFDQIDYIFIQLFSNFKFNKEILNDYLHIYTEKDKIKIIKKLYEEKRKIALELGLPFDINEEEQILNTKNDINDENTSCNIF